VAGVAEVAGVVWGSGLRIWVCPVDREAAWAVATALADWGRWDKNRRWKRE
jgi:hypothetical protein